MSNQRVACSEIDACTIIFQLNPCGAPEDSGLEFRLMPHA